MKKTVTVNWNFDLEEGKQKGFVLVLGKNSDGSIGIGYGIWDDDENAWLSEDLTPMPNFTVKAWLKDVDLIPADIIKNGF